MPDQKTFCIRPSPLGDGLLHGSCVAFDGQAVLLLGPSGSGKSALALDLMSRGAKLVADDQIILTVRAKKLWASAPEAIAGKIEARSVGVLKAEPLDTAPVALVVDLGRVEKDRLPQPHTITRLGVTLPLLFNVPAPHFAPAILQFLSHGRDV